VLILALAVSSDMVLRYRKRPERDRRGRCGQAAQRQPATERAVSKERLDEEAKIIDGGGAQLSIRGRDDRGGRGGSSSEVTVLQLQPETSSATCADGEAKNRRPCSGTCAGSAIPGCFPECTGQSHVQVKILRVRSSSACRRLQEHR